MAPFSLVSNLTTDSLSCENNSHLTSLNHDLTCPLVLAADEALIIKSLTHKEINAVIKVISVELSICYCLFISVLLRCGTYFMFVFFYL